MNPTTRMMNPRKMDGRAFGWMYAVTIALSAFLLFQVQPVISKTILPWFGGSPAVWTTCLLFFQVLLLAGYGYAHGLISRVRSNRVVFVHVPLLLIASCLLPITPQASWKPDASQSPTFWILWLLLANVGLPYFLVASTAPLVQAWFAQTYTHRSPYRLYALSNAASLAALLSYPVLIEPAMTTQTQCAVWSIGFGLFALCSGALCVMMRRAARGTSEANVATVHTSTGEPSSAKTTAAVTWRTKLVWLLLPALASMMLLAVTNHLCRQLLVVPFLWIAPLSVYLVTFIICFDNQRWYVPRWFALLAAMSVLLVCNMMLSPTAWQFNILIAGGVILAMQFLVSMVCHGELVRLKPAASRLTSFYLMIATGGALGGVFVALVCPLIFDSYWEFKLGMLACFLVALVTVYREGVRYWFGALPVLKWVTLLGGVVGLFMISTVRVGTQIGIPVKAMRSFYGVLSIRDIPSVDDPLREGRAMYHGNTMHGFQYTSDENRNRPTLYYEPQSAVGMLLSRYPRKEGLHVGVIGLGVGTLAAYGQPGDRYRFYEIDADVIELCEKYFTFVKESKATVEIVKGDARLVLEQESSQAFDVLVIDAFSDDSIPTHLLSKEAFEVYQRHLKPDGVLAFHVSNRHLKLGLVVGRLADHFQIPARYVIHAPGVLEIERPSSIWMLVSNNETILNDDEIRKKSAALPGSWRDLPLWTDKYSSLHPLLW